MKENKLAGWSVNRIRGNGGRNHRVYTVVLFVVLVSLDNAAIGVLPPLYVVVSRDIGVAESSLGLVTAATLVTLAVSSAIWGYWSDRARRKDLLIVATVVWAAGMILTGLVDTLAGLLTFQIVTAVGLGGIASIGFSLVSDFIPPNRRGLAMSFWGIAQGIGTVGGALLGGVIGASNWSLPFFVVAVAGLLGAVLYLFAYEPRRGQADVPTAPETGIEIEYRIQPMDVGPVISIPTNKWLIVQGFTAQIAYGSLLWFPRLMVGKFEALGYNLETSTVAASIFATILQVGGLFSIAGGYVGDIWHRRNPRGRALLCVIGISGAIPLFVLLFFVPVGGIDLSDREGVLGLSYIVLLAIVSSAWIAAAALLAVTALALTSVDSPNWAAMIADVNLPENRGTVFGTANLSNGLGRALGNGTTGLVFAWLGTIFPSPTSFAVGLALFQIAFIPTAVSYFMASRTVQNDSEAMRRTLAERSGLELD